jgi:hypothetical protein
VRDRVLRTLVICGVALLVITEAFSAFNGLTRIPLIVSWLIFLAALTAIRWRHVRQPFPVLNFDPVVLLCAAGIVAILSLTFIAAIFSPPNSSDAMAYHMPRIVYWAEQSSIRFFPTTYLNQIMLQPLAEYLMLHTYILSGGDHFINLVQWSSSLGCLIGVSAVARCLGAGRRGQWISALFCATIPAGILASSGAKNDYFMAFWLVAAAYFAFCLAASGSWTDSAFLGAACGLAMCTKATAYLFLPWIILAVLGPALARSPRRITTAAFAAAVLALALNAPQYIRNYELSRSPMGFDSAHGDSVYRWRNEKFGWGPTISNMLRHTSEQLGRRSERWNAFVFQSVVRIHHILGLNENDPATTWPWTNYRAPRNANHETDAPNRLHLLMLALLSCVFVFESFRGKYHQQARYAAALALAFVAFCAYLKWQLFMARLLLPLFVLGAPLAGSLEEILSPTLFQLAACLLLLDGARLPSLENWVRPLRGAASIFHSSRDSRYFADMTTWNNAPSFMESVQSLSTTSCGVIGIDISHFELEYPLQALLRKNKPGVLFVHTGVANASNRYAPPVSAKPCAVVCLECAGDSKHLALYGDFPHTSTAGKFVILTK